MDNRSVSGYIWHKTPIEIPAMLATYSVPTSIDQQINDLEAEEIVSAMLAASGYFDLWIESQAKIALLNNALNNLN